MSVIIVVANLIVGTMFGCELLYVPHLVRSLAQSIYIMNAQLFNESVYVDIFEYDISVVSDSLWPHGLYSPWNSPGQDTGVGSLSLLQGIFPTQESNPGPLHCRWILYQLSHKESPRILEWVAYPFYSGSFKPRNLTGVSCIASGFFTNWTIREALYIAQTFNIMFNHKYSCNKYVSYTYAIFKFDPKQFNPFTIHFIILIFISILKSLSICPLP